MWLLPALDPSAVDPDWEQVVNAGDDPVNFGDPSGLMCWGFCTLTNAAKSVGHFVVTHKKGVEIGLGIVLGVAAAATGVGAVIEAAAVAGL